MSNLSVSATPEFRKVAVGGDKSQQHFLINLEGKKISLENRKPLALAAVIDCSGSMAGEKIEMAKKTLIKLIENLSSEDSLGCAGFSTNVFQIFPVQKMTPEAKEKAKAEVERLRSMDSTNLAGGMLEGFGYLKEVAASYDVVRVLLMTDGLPNVGVSDHEGLVDMVKKRPDRVTLSTFGYGQDHNPELLMSMAKAGKGNFHFIKTVDECPAVFGRELGGLLTCVAQNIKVKVKAKTDVKILEVLSDFDVDGKDDKSVATVSVDDVYSEERRRILLKVELPAFEKVPPRPLKVADIEVEFFDVQAKEPRSESTKMEIEYVKGADAQKESAPEIKEEFARLKAAKAQAEAVKLASVGNFVGAQQLVMDAAMFCRSVGTQTADAYAADLEVTCSSSLKEETYDPNYLISNSVSYGTGRGQTAGAAKLFSTPMAKSTAKKFSDEEKIEVKPPMLTNAAPTVTNEGSLSKRRQNRS